MTSIFQGVMTWKSYYAKCLPCDVKYDAIMKVCFTLKFTCDAKIKVIFTFKITCDSVMKVISKFRPHSTLILFAFCSLSLSRILFVYFQIYLFFQKFYNILSSKHPFYSWKPTQRMRSGWSIQKTWHRYFSYPKLVV